MSVEVEKVDSQLLRSLFRGNTSFKVKVKKTDTKLFPVLSPLEQLTQTLTRQQPTTTTAGDQENKTTPERRLGSGTTTGNGIRRERGEGNTQLLEGQHNPLSTVTTGNTQRQQSRRQPAVVGLRRHRIILPGGLGEDLPLSLSPMNNLECLKATTKNHRPIPAAERQQQEELTDDQAGRIMIQELRLPAICCDLTLVKLKFSMEITAELFNAIASSGNLLRLFFWGCSFGMESVERTKYSSQLLSVTEPHNLEKIFYAAFVNNDRIKLLDLSECNIGDEGVTGVAQALKKNCTIRKLNLNRNRIGTKGAVALGEALEVNETLFTLLLTDNLIGEEGIQRLARGLMTNHHLGILKLSKNFVRPTGAKCLSEALEMNRGLLELELNHCSLERAGIDYMLKSLSQNSTILKLDLLEGNSVGYNPEDSSELKKSLKSRMEQNKQYFKQVFQDALKKNKRGPWNRARLLFIGQGRAGKTATVRALLHESFEEEWDSTIGASLTQLSTRAADDTGWAKQRDEGDFTSMHAARILAAERSGRNYKGSFFGDASERGSFIAGDYEGSLHNRLTAGTGSKTGTLKRRNATDRKKKRITYHRKSIDQAVQFVRRTRHTSLPNGVGNAQLKKRNVDLKKADAGEIASFDVEKFISKPYEQALTSRMRQDREALNFSIWDFGGQEVFYTMHHLFLTKHGLYFVVFNCAEVLQYITDGTVAHQSEKPDKYIRFWLNSAAVHAPGAPIFLVGTHLDELEAGSHDLDIINEFLLPIVNKINFIKVVENREDDYCFFPVDNRRLDGIHKLQLVIEKEARSQEHVIQLVPIRWMACYDQLLQVSKKRRTSDTATREVGNELLKKKGRPSKKKKVIEPPSWLSFDEVKDHARAFEITSAYEVEAMLKLFNELGVLIYMTGSSKLRQKVILKPQWLLRVLGQVIRDSSIHKHNAAFKELKLEEDVRLAYSKGLFSRDLLEHLWDGEDVDFLIDLMKQTMLLSEWQFSSSGEKLFLVPSLLKSKAAEKRQSSARSSFVFGNSFKRIISVASRLSFGEPKSRKYKCVFDFSKSFLPTGVFERLICVSISLAASYLSIETAKDGNSKRGTETLQQPVLSKNFCELPFRGSTVYKAQLVLNEDDLTISVLLFAGAEDKALAAETAGRLLQYITGILKKVNDEIMNTGLTWDVLFEVEEGEGKEVETEAETGAGGEESDLQKKQTMRELVTMKEASKMKLFPWFAETGDKKKTNYSNGAETLNLEAFLS